MVPHLEPDEQLLAVQQETKVELHVSTCSCYVMWFGIAGAACSSNFHKL